MNEKMSFLLNGKSLNRDYEYPLRIIGPGFVGALMESLTHIDSIDLAVRWRSLPW